jgi:hypothetical protein
VGFSAFPEHKEAWKVFYGVQLIPDKFVYMMCFVTGLYSDPAYPGVFTRMRLEFQDLRGNIIAATYGREFTARAQLFNLRNLVPRGWMLDSADPNTVHMPNHLKMEDWVHCVVFDKAPQFFRPEQYQDAQEYGLAGAVHFWSTFGAGGELRSDPELGAGYRVTRADYHAFSCFDGDEDLLFGPMVLYPPRLGGVTEEKEAEDELEEADEEDADAESVVLVRPSVLFDGRCTVPGV